MQLNGEEFVDLNSGYIIGPALSDGTFVISKIGGTDTRHMKCKNEGIAIEAREKLIKSLQRRNKDIDYLVDKFSKIEEHLANLIKVIQRNS